MFRTLRQWLTQSRSAQPSRPMTTLQFEALEDRTVPSAYISSGILHVDGTSVNDSITVREAETYFRVRVGAYSMDFLKSRVTAGQIRIQGLGGNDLIDVSAVRSARTVIYGGHGIDTIRGSSNRDIIYGGSGNDTLYGGNDFDVLSGDDGNDTLYGGNGDDWLIGGNGDDYLSGDDGNDLLSGGSGNDRLSEGNGRNSLHGGDGNDRAWVNAVSRVFQCERVDISVPGGSPQTDNWSCGPNSASRFLRAYGFEISYEALRSRAECWPDLVSQFRFGTRPGSLRDLMAIHRPDTQLATEASFDTVVNLLRQGKPVIALVASGLASDTAFGKVGNLHYVVLDGIDVARRIICYTDTDGVRKSWSYEEFQDRWNWGGSWFTGVAGDLAQGFLNSLGVHERTIIY